jgi:lipoprotein-anchoring transpeptidase ErfK/SrfK
MQPAPRKIQVSISRQELQLLEGGQLVAAYPVSTSKFGTGTEPGSNKTPLGLFRVGERHGGGAPWGTIFKSRQPVGSWQPGDDCSAGDYVLTRILWLEGLDESNANTKERFIYIHGTNQEELIGQPASMGCVRLRNDDVITLFEFAPEGTEVEIIA